MTTATSPRLNTLAEESAFRFKIRQHPDIMCEEIFGGKLWPAQKEIIKAMFKYNKVAVRSCHDIGKTYIAARAVLLYSRAYNPSRILTTAPTNNQVEKLLWGEVNSAFNSSDPPFPGRCLNTKYLVNDLHDAIGFSTNNPLNLQGWHSPNMLVAVDEAANVEREIYDKLKTILTSANAKQFLIGNPDDPLGKFAEAFEDPSFHTIKISAFDTPNFTEFGITLEDIANDTWKEKIARELPYPELITPEWVRDAYLDWGPESSLFLSKVLADFPKATEDQMFNLADVEAAQKSKRKGIGLRQFGLDVARFGADKSVLIYRVGPRALLKWSFKGLDTWKLAEWVRGLTLKFSPSKDIPIVIDTTGGLGAGVADSMRQFGFSVTEYIGSGAARKPEYYNIKAEWYWHLRNMFSKNEIGGEVIDDETKQELCALRYEYNGGKLKMEKKAKTKKRIGRSPDNADALMMAFAPIVPIIAGKKSLKNIQKQVDEYFNRPVFGYNKN